MQRSDHPTDERILDAAEACVQRLGLRHLSVGEVARRAGVSRGSVYRYFADRDALIDAVLERVAERFVAGSRPAVARRRSLAAQVGEAAVFIREHVDDEQLTLPLGEEDSILAILLTARSSSLVERWVEFWQPFLARAAARGEIREGLDHQAAAEWIVRLLLSLVLMPSVAVDLDDPEAVRHFVQSYIVRGLGR